MNKAASLFLSLCLLLLSLSSANSSANSTSNQSLSPKTYQALNDIQQLLADKQYVQVEQELTALEESLNPGFGLALTYQIHAQLFLAQDNNSQALVYFNKSLQLEAMKATQAVSLATNVAQLYLADGAINNALTVLAPRIAAAEKEKPESTNAMAFITMGSAYQLQENYAQAIHWLQQGIERADKPRENWLQMLMAAHYQQKQYKQAIAVLDRLITLNGSKEEYWLQQASLYQAMNNSKGALNVLQLAHVRGVLAKEDGLILLVQLLISEGIPERAGRILLSLLTDNKIEITEDNWQLLASAWIQGRERLKAIAAFTQAAEMAIDSKQKSSKAAANLYYRIAQIQFDEGLFLAAASSFEKARSLGISDKKVGLSLLLQGNAYFELEEYSEAKLYFSKALKEASSTNSARGWLDYMEQLELF